MEIYYNDNHNSTIIHRDDLLNFQMHSNMINVYNFKIEEWASCTRSEPAIINVKADFHCVYHKKTGFCLMMIGRSKQGANLWACALSGSLEPDECYEYADSVLISKSAIVDVSEVMIIIHGGTLEEMMP